MPDQPIALVLAGGGARGAYEAGVLSVILPALPADQRPNLIVGSSVGAVNGAYIAATLWVAWAERWSLWRTLFGLAASIPPLTTLIFERWVARRRPAAEPAAATA